MTRSVQIRCLAAGLVVLVISLPTHSKLQAQLSEFKLTRFVPNDTFAALYLNTDAIFEKVDFDDPVVAKLFEAAGGYGWNPNLEQALFLFSSKVDDERPGAMPVVTLMKFNQPITPEAWFQKHQLSTFVQFEPKDYKDQEIYEGKFKQAHGSDEFDQAFFFPDEKTVVVADREMVRHAIDGESTNSASMDLVNNLDTEAELHFLFEGSDKIDANVLGGLGFGTLIGGLIGDAKRLEVLGSYSEQRPLQITIEMNNDEQMDRVVEMIDAGVAAAPLALDGVAERLDELAPDEAAPAFRDLIALGRTALEKMKTKRENTTLRITLERVDNLENLPQLLIVSLGALLLASAG